MPPARFATRRRPERETWGPIVGLIAREKLGRPLMPAQQYICDVALEIDNDTRGLAYDVVLVTVPRQTGKTTGVLFPVYVLRCTMWAIRQMCVYTAQDRNSAAKKFKNDFLEILEAAPGYRRNVDYTVRKANGSEEIFWTKTRSHLWISATNPSSGHGDALDMPGLDEIFEHHDLEVDQGFNPPMVTREDAQKWLLSTAGDRRSIYLKDKRRIGRESTIDDSGVGFAHFEWSAGDPGSFEDWDDDWIHDRARWWQIMPALGHTQTEAKVASQLTELKERGFRRAFGNLDDEDDDGGIDPIDIEDWSAAVLDRRQVGVLERVIFGVEVPRDRSRATIGLASARAKGGYLLEIAEARQGTRWVPARLAEMHERNTESEGVAIDPGSAAGSLIPDIESLGVPVIKMGARQHADACGALVDRVPTGEVFHLGDDLLTDAVLDAKTRPLGDAWAWKRADADITPLVACTLAFGALLTEPVPEPPKESVYSTRGLYDWSDLED